MYVVYSVSHDDCYKRADSSASVDKVYKIKENAYEYAIKNQIQYFKDYFDWQEEDIDFYFKDKTNEEIYNYIHENFQYVFGEGEFTMLPTHTIYNIKYFEKFDD